MKRLSKISIYLLSFSFILLASCKNDTKKVIIQTAYGDMIFELYNSTPKHRDNFVKLVTEGYYDGLLFHRIMRNFMIQGGDPDSRNASPTQRLGIGGPGYTIEEEIGAPHFKGTLSAARLGDAQNPTKRSSGSQFFVVKGEKLTKQSVENMARLKNIQYSPDQMDKYLRIGGYPSLDMEYTVFGEMISGMEVLDKLSEVATGVADRPVEDIPMTIKMYTK